MNIKIERNIALPPKRGNHGVCYPFDKMEIGDSFSVPTPKHRKVQSFASTLSSCARSWANAHGKKVKFTCRIQDNNVRIWRIK